jgi:hypothetical protein
MEHLSDWHSFDPNYRSTYPKVNAPIQVKYANGSLAEGDCRKFFPQKFKYQTVMTEDVVA